MRFENTYPQKGEGSSMIELKTFLSLDPSNANGKRCVEKHLVLLFSKFIAHLYLLPLIFYVYWHVSKCNSMPTPPSHPNITAYTWLGPAIRAGMVFFWHMVISTWPDIPSNLKCLAHAERLVWVSNCLARPKLGKISIFKNKFKWFGTWNQFLF